MSLIRWGSWSVLTSLSTCWPTVSIESLLTAARCGSPAAQDRKDLQQTLHALKTHTSEISTTLSLYVTVFICSYLICICQTKSRFLCFADFKQGYLTSVLFWQETLNTTEDKLTEEWSNSEEITRSVYFTLKDSTGYGKRRCCRCDVGVASGGDWEHLRPAASGPTHLDRSRSETGGQTDRRRERDRWADRQLDSRTDR